MYIGLTDIPGEYKVCMCACGFCGTFSLDQIEDLELQLTNIIKQLQDYRMKQEHAND